MVFLSPVAVDAHTAIPSDEVPLDEMNALVTDMWSLAGDCNKIALGKKKASS
jgi:hypothetical protein